jgi:hypothetical protein
MMGTEMVSESSVIFNWLVSESDDGATDGPWNVGNF